MVTRTRLDCATSVLENLVAFALLSLVCFVADSQTVPPTLLSAWQAGSSTVGAAAVYGTIGLEVDCAPLQLG